MIKVSFIAIVLAAIGYKEYNSSIIGNWSDGRDKTSWIEYTRDSVIVHHPDLQQPDGTAYSRYVDTLTYHINDSMSFEMEIHRKNKRKLIFIDKSTGAKIKFKKVPDDKVVCLLPIF
jgi:hypothetical protein